MTLEELESIIKEMRDDGAGDNTEIFIYSNSSEFSITGIDYCISETKISYIELTIHEKF